MSFIFFATGMTWRNFLLSYLRAVGMEYDDLNSKSREAEKDVNMLQMKIQEVNHNLSRYQKEMECEFFFLPVF